MITEDYVSFETAKLLKEKGFNEHCFCVNYPLPEGGHHNIILPDLLNNSIIPFIDEYKFCRYKEDFITIPTLQMAMKWLREIHHIIIVSHPLSFNITKDCLCENWVYSLWVGNKLEVHESLGNQTNYSSYEETCEAAFKYCHEHNLI